MMKGSITLDRDELNKAIELYLNETQFKEGVKVVNGYWMSPVASYTVELRQVQKFHEWLESEQQQESDDEKFQINDCIKLIDEEIKWSETHRGLFDFRENYEEGFIKGLIQAKNLLVKLQEIEDK